VAAVLAMSVGTLLFAELAVRASEWAGIFRPMPVTALHRVYDDAHPIFGIWHHPSTSARHVGACFDVAFTTNRFGSRDRERSENGGGRAVVLGDSFVEGYGVEASDRLTDRMEAATGHEFLNFGISGNVSHVQEALVYEHLAMRFEHEQVFVLLLPDNDWIESDPERFWEPERRRPYLDESDGFSVVYTMTPEEAEESIATREARAQWDRRFALSRLATQVRRTFRAWRAQAGAIGHNDFTEADFSRLTRSYDRIAALAGSRHVTIASIPRLQELRFVESGGELVLPRRLSEFAAQRGFQYVDFSEAFLRDAKRNGRPLEDYFHSCDGHWSPLGHEIAATALLSSAPPFQSRIARPGK
jgi:hypothetical protein